MRKCGRWPPVAPGAVLGLWERVCAKSWQAGSGCAARRAGDCRSHGGTCRNICPLPSLREAPDPGPSVPPASPGRSCRSCRGLPRRRRHVFEVEFRFPGSGGRLCLRGATPRAERCPARSGGLAEPGVYWTSRICWGLLRGRQEPEMERGRAGRATGGAQVLSSHVKLMPLDAEGVS